MAKKILSSFLISVIATIICCISYCAWIDNLVHKIKNNIQKDKTNSKKDMVDIVKLILRPNPKLLAADITNTTYNKICQLMFDVEDNCCIVSFTSSDLHRSNHSDAFIEAVRLHVEDDLKKLFDNVEKIEVEGMSSLVTIVKVFVGESV